MTRTGSCLSTEATIGLGLEANSWRGRDYLVRALVNGEIHLSGLYSHWVNTSSGPIPKGVQGVQWGGGHLFLFFSILITTTPHTHGIMIFQLY